jgi:hypothetical protein
MGSDRYGLNLNVWGDSHNTPQPSKSPLDDRIGRNCGEPPKAARADDEENASDGKKESTAQYRIKKAEFVPVAGETDFNKPCTVRAEIESDKGAHGQVTFALWATYNGTEYDLSHKSQSGISDGVAQTQLKLFYVDQYYQDATGGGKAKGKVEYYAKVIGKDGQVVESDRLVMPFVNTTRLLLQDASGSPLAGATVTLSDGSSFSADDCGTVVIESAAGTEKITISGITVNAKNESSPQEKTAT